MGVSSETAQTSHKDMVRLIRGFRGPYYGFVYQIIWEFIRIYIKGLEFGLYGLGIFGLGFGDLELRV